MSLLEALRQILIAPLMRWKPENMLEEDFLEVMWCVKERVISRYSVIRDFYIPGLYVTEDAGPVQGIYSQYRFVPRLSHIFVRVDDTQPNIIHVENHDHVFQLSREEWQTIRGFIKRGFKQDEI